MEVPNIEATTEGNYIFSPKEWLERFWQHNTKRKYKMDKLELIRRAEITQNGCTANEGEYRKILYRAMTQKHCTK